MKADKKRRIEGHRKQPKVQATPPNSAGRVDFLS